jgi:uncharacterized protein YqjF (DUF2071 family)
MVHVAFQQTNHRPWELPKRPWSMAMTWYDLAFLHWPVPLDSLRPHIAAGLELDTFDGQAWLGVVPFGMTGIRPRGVPSMPWISRFLELNLRTYVSCGGKAGVWFFSLDAANPVAVRAARWFYHLPYFDASMRLQEDQEGWLNYRSRRTHRGELEVEFEGRYRPSGPQFTATPGSLEYWLTERYCLYAADRRGGLYRGEIHHHPWPLRRGEAQIAQLTLGDPWDVPLEGPPKFVHFARRIDVVAWSLTRVNA